MDKQELISEIYNCFKNIPFPGNENIIYRDFHSNFEALQIRDKFKVYTWEDIDDEILIRNSAALNYLSDDAFVYFLPSYMKLLILKFEAADVVIDSLILHLTLPLEIDVRSEYINYKMDNEKSVDLDEYFRYEISHIEEKVHNFIRKTSLFSFEQSKCILKFLNYIKQYYSDHFDTDILNKPIKRYWFKFGDIPN